MSSFESLNIPGTVINQDGSPVSAEILSGKIIGLYFSAHWCGPCRAFTPKLAEKYKEIVNEGNSFEIIFISADESEETALEYFKEMPWKMISFSDREAEETLSQRYGVRGIPFLVLLDESGEVITTDGRNLIMDTPFGSLKTIAAEKKAQEEAAALQLIALKKSFKPSEYFAGSIVDNTKVILPSNHLEGKVVGIYFSAHWCGPCRSFTPKLAARYSTLLAEGRNFDIVFVSSDRDESSAEEYFSEMPWEMLSYVARDKKKALSDLFDVQGIPTLILLDESGAVISKDGDEAVMSPWDNWKTFDEKKVIEAEKQAREVAELSVAFKPSEYFDAIRIIDAAESAVPSGHFASKIVGIYFAALGDAVSKRFTPQLVERYKELKAAGVDIEIVFVSFDREESSARSFFATMPWTMLPYDNVYAKRVLSQVFDLSGLPSLVLTSDDEGLITTEGTAFILTGSIESIRERAAAQKALEKNIDEEIHKYPDSVTIDAHEHSLSKTAKVYAGHYGCDVCGKGGAGWVYHCDTCGFDAHPWCGFCA